MYNVFSSSTGTDVEEVVKAKDSRYTQPFLLSTGNVQNPEHYFIVVDRIAIPCGKDVVKALDMLFKSHYVINVEYAIFRDGNEMISCSSLNVYSCANVMLNCILLP